MATLRLQVDRLNLALHGVAAEVTGNLSRELERALADRLGRPGGEPLARGDFFLRELSLPALHISSALDAAALAGMVADRLIEELTLHSPSPDEGGPR